MSSAPDTQAPGKSASKSSANGSQLPLSSSRQQFGGVLSASACSLLSSFTNPSPSSVTASLASCSAGSSPEKSSHTQYPPSSSSPHPSTNSRARIPTYSSSISSHTSSTNDIQGFRSQQPNRLYSSEDEFNSFGKLSPAQFHTKKLEYTLPPPNGHNPHREVADDGLDVASLLSQPLTSEIYSPDPELRGINTARPTIRSFTICDDPVEFLSTTTEYTEDVWGEHLKVVREAREEVLKDGKGKGKQDSGGTAIARLRMIWGHLRVSGDSRQPR